MTDDHVYTKEFAEDVIACAKQMLSEVHLSGGSMCAYCSEKTKDDKHWLECTKHPARGTLFLMQEVLDAAKCELVEADATICRLCKRLNPQHAECTSCEDRESLLAVIQKAKGE